MVQIEPWFVAAERFGPWCGERWTRYVEWSGLEQLKELVKLDPMLCPTVTPEIREEDWAHIVNEDCFLPFYVDLAYLRRRMAGVGERNVFCAYRNPAAFANDEFTPMGLLGTHARALEVRAALRTLYPEARHAECDVWAVFRAELI